MKPRTLGIIAGVLILVLVGFFLFRLPQPIIELRPETLFSLGPFDVTNTIFTAWVMIALISIVTIVGTRRLSLIPHGFQNLFEAVVEGYGNLVNGVAGERNGRRFFPVVFIFFFYIVLCNWVALTPVFNVIGVTENLSEEYIDEARAHPDETVHKAETVNAWVMKKQAGLSVVPLFKSTELVKVNLTEGMTFAQRRDALFNEVRAAQDLEPTENVEQYLEENHTFVGFIAPFFRGVNTDVNATLSYAIWSAIFVEFWGVTTLGVLGYGSKFFNFKGGPIGIFVGLLELISEFARLISFTFRLFGNIFAGEVLLFMMSFLVPFVLVDVFYMLELFVGLIQAFVFSMLTLVFAVMAVSGHGDHDEGHGAHAEAGAHAAAHG